MRPQKDADKQQYERNKYQHKQRVIRLSHCCSPEKEAYRQLEKTATYRIGVGARVNSSDDLSFFLEIVVKLSSENSELDLPRLEKSLAFLKVLQMRGYSITYQDNNSVSCEIKTSKQEIHEEYATAKSLANTHLR